MEFYFEKQFLIYLFVFLFLYRSSHSSFPPEVHEWHVFVEESGTHDVQLFMTLDFITTDWYEEATFLFAKPVLCPSEITCANFVTRIEDPIGFFSFVFTFDNLIPAERYEYEFYIEAIKEGYRFVVLDTDVYALEKRVSFCTKPLPPNVVEYSSTFFEANSTKCVNVEPEPDPDANENVSQVVFLPLEPPPVTRPSEKAACAFGAENEETSIEVVNEFSCPGQFHELLRSETLRLDITGETIFGLPAEITKINYEFLSKSIVSLSWDTSDGDFDSYDSFVIKLNDETQEMAEEERDSKSSTLEGLSLCEDYTVEVFASLNGRPGKAKEAIVRSWNNTASVEKLLADYPDAAKKCGKCVNVEKTRLCAFPFNHDGSDVATCIADQIGLENPWCLTADQEKVTCSLQVLECLPPEPELSDLSFRTIGVAHIEVSWDTVGSNNQYTSFILTLNEVKLEETLEKSKSLDGLTVGEEYVFQVAINSYGRIGKSKSVAFIASDQTSNAFTSQASKDSATVSWDESEDGSQKVINITGQSTSLTEKLFDKNKNEEYLVETNAVNVTDLSPGTKTNVEIFTVGENQDKNGESIKTTISTVPRALDSSENSLTLKVLPNNGIGVSGFFTNKTYAEKLIFILNKVLPMVTIEEDGDFTYIASQTDETSSSEDSCASEECVEPDTIHFDRTVAHGAVEAGILYEVVTTSQTGPSESDPTSLYHVQPPNPVPGEFIRAYSVTAYEIKLTWKPPSTGYYVGFRVEYEDQNEERFVHNIDGFLRFFAGDLLPGHNYVFDIYTTTHGPPGSDDLTLSTVTKFSQDTAPFHPDGVTALHYIYDTHPNTYTLNIQPPNEGLWSYFEVKVNDRLSESSDKDVFTTAKNDQQMAIEFSRHGTIYDIEVVTISANGERSRYSTHNYVITVPPTLEQEDVTVLVHNAEDTCVLWQKEKNPSIYHEVKAILYRGRAKIEQKVSKNFEENQSTGLICLKTPDLHAEVSYRLHMQTGVSYPPDQPVESEDREIYQFDSNSIEISPKFEVSIDCGNRGCTVSIDDGKTFPKVEDLVFHVTLNNLNVTSAPVTETFVGTQCNQESGLCNFALNRVSDSSSYRMDIIIQFYGQVLPANFSSTFLAIHFREPRVSSTIALSIGLSLGAVFIVGIIIGIVAYKCKKGDKEESEGRQKSEYHTNPIFELTNEYDAPNPNYADVFVDNRSSELYDYYDASKDEIVDRDDGYVGSIYDQYKNVTKEYEYNYGHMLDKFQGNVLPSTSKTHASRFQSTDDDYESRALSPTGLSSVDID